MKKTVILLAIALVVCLVSVFALSACNLEKILENIQIEEEGIIDVTADGKKDSFELLYGFFEETLKSADVVVTVKSGEEVQFTESIKGTASNVVTKDGTTIYAFMKDDTYYYAYENEDNRYYEIGEDAKQSYDTYYGYFMCNFKLFEMVPEDSGTFSCATHIEETTDDEQKTESTGELTFDYVAEEGTLKITANAQNGLVQSATITTDDKTHPSDSRTITMTFVYGSATVTTPNVDAWATADNNKAAIENRDGFFFETYFYDNVTITMINGEENSMVETIANGVDYVLYSAGNSTYAFMVDNDEEESEYIYGMVQSEENGGGKSYYTGETAYETGSMVYYNFFNMFDFMSDMEGITFTCNIEEDEDGQNGTMTYEVKNSVVSAVTITATKVNGLVTEATIASSGIAYVVTFEYDTAELTAPDISDWQNSGSMD